MGAHEGLQQHVSSGETERREQSQLCNYPLAVERRGGKTIGQTDQLWQVCGLQQWVVQWMGVWKGHSFPARFAHHRPQWQIGPERCAEVWPLRGGSGLSRLLPASCVLSAAQLAPHLPDPV